MQNVLKIAVICATALAPEISQAQAADDYPNKPVVIVLPVTPGSSSEGEMRSYSTKLTEMLGKPFVLEYKSGVGGTLSHTYVAKAAPDGYTLAASNSSFTTSAAYYPNLSYDPVKDFIPISMLTQVGTVFLTYPTAPFRTVKEYIAYAKANPERINFGLQGHGGIHHLVSLNMHDIAGGAKVTYVDYKSATAKNTDLMAGRIEAVYSTINVTAGTIKSGKLRALAVMGPRRSPVLPDVPTLVEQGVNMVYPGWLGIQAPARTPAAITNKLNASFLRVLKDPEVVKRLDADASIVIGSTPEQFRQHIVAEIASWKAIAAKSGVKLGEQ